MSDSDHKNSEKGEQVVNPIVQVNTLDSDHKNQGGAAVEEASFVFFPPCSSISRFVADLLILLQASRTAVWSFLCHLSQLVYVSFLLFHLLFSS